MNVVTARHVHDRWELAPGLVAFMFEYFNPESATREGALSTGLELSVQLSGQWTHLPAGEPPREVRAGESFVINPGERYGYRYDARAGPGLQVGFLLYPHEFLPGRVPPGGALHLPPARGLERYCFVALAAEVARAARQGEPLPVGQAVSEFQRLLGACDMMREEPLLKARREIESGLGSQLYLRHLAELAQMRPDTFYRRFTQRFGVGPVRYRLLARLAHAARLTWRQPQLTVRGIAEAVGFDDAPYFHRIFRRHFGLSPAAYGRRQLLARQ